MVIVRVPASTANLGPGFDVFGMALDGLSNYIQLERISKGLKITVEGEGEADIPKDESNVVYKSIISVFNRSKYTIKDGISIHINNEIPLSRGLGSSAAAIVGGVVAANEILERPLSNYQLLNIAADIEGHSDNVLAALFGKLVVLSKIHDEIIFRQIDLPENLFTVAAIPEFNLSTKNARNVLPEFYSKTDTVFNIGNSALLIWAFINNDYELVKKVMDDKLHQPYRKHLIPGMEDVVSAAKLNNSIGVALSGAGPTIIALCDSKVNASKIGMSMIKAFENNNINAYFKIMSPNNIGAEIIQ